MCLLVRCWRTSSSNVCVIAEELILNGWVLLYALWYAWVTWEIKRTMQKAWLSGVLRAFRSHTVYANACQETAFTPRHWHINIYVQMLRGWKKGWFSSNTTGGRGKRGVPGKRQRQDRAALKVRNRIERAQKFNTKGAGKTFFRSCTYFTKRQSLIAK